jgi:hypothetical protein
MATITAANSVFALAITGLYPSPQILSGYGADDAFTTEAMENAEVVQGLDGHLSGGFIFNPVKQTITIMPDSPSLEIFNNWALAQLSQREVMTANASISLPSIGFKYVLKRGFLTSSRPVPDVKKLLAAVPYQITWESVIGARI